MKITLLGIAITLIFGSCATVKFYDDGALKKETGIEFYQAKPYLLVEKKPAKDVAVKSTIIYLPDMSRPKYAKLKTGFGSSDLKLSMTNGIITSYGVTSDSKIPETITALTGVLGATGTTYKSFAEAIDILKGENDDEEIEEQAGDVKSMQQAKKIIDNVLIDLGKASKSDLLTAEQKSQLVTVIADLKKQNDEINKLSIKEIPKISSEVDKIIKSVSKIKIDSESDSGKDLKVKLGNNIKELSKARELMLPKKKAPEPSIELYEILITNKGTELKKIALANEIQKTAGRK